MYQLFSNKTWSCSIPDNMTMRNLLITNDFKFVKDCHPDCEDNEITTCHTEGELYDFLGEFYGSY